MNAFYPPFNDRRTWGRPHVSVRQFWTEILKQSFEPKSGRTYHPKGREEKGKKPIEISWKGPHENLRRKHVICRIFLLTTAWPIVFTWENTITFETKKFGKTCGCGLILVCVGGCFSWSDATTKIKVRTIKASVRTGYGQFSWINSYNWCPLFEFRPPKPSLHNTSHQNTWAMHGITSSDALESTVQFDRAFS